MLLTNSSLPRHKKPQAYQLQPARARNRISDIMAKPPSHVIPSADTIEYQSAKVTIVGAGPAGLFLALKLALQKIDVLVLEAEPDVLQSPRATTSVMPCSPD